MCLSVLAYRVSRLFPFVLIHNRDEFLSRPFQRVHIWQEELSPSNGLPSPPPPALSSVRVWGGRDLKSQGMWLGVNDAGYFGAITNYRDPKSFRPDASSRGALVRDFLTRPVPPKTFIETNRERFGDLNAFNLLFGSFDSPNYFSSRSDTLTKIDSGIYGLSNRDLDTPWPKVIRAKNKVADILGHANDPGVDLLIQNLLSVLEDQTLAPVSNLPSTGVGLEAELALSSIFVSTPGYGTLTSAVIVVNADGTVTFCEKDHFPSQPHLAQTPPFKFKMRSFPVHSSL